MNDGREPFPVNVAIAQCSNERCKRLRFGVGVNREDELPQRYCSHCGSPLVFAMYVYLRRLGFLK